MIDQLHLIEDDQEYLEEIRKEIDEAIAGGMKLDHDGAFDATITISGDEVKKWYNEKRDNLNDAINGMTDPDIKSSLLVLLERFRLYTFIAFHPKRPTDESRGEYYKLKRQRNG